MLRSLRTAEQALQSDQARIDVLANNLANVNTAGFKQVLVTAQQRVGGGATGPGRDGAVNDQASGRRRLEQGDFWPQARPTRLRMAVDARQGSLRGTGRGADMALQGRGFFVVKTENGPLYTRDGSFRLDDKQRLVTAHGLPVQGTGGDIVLDGSSFSVSADGTVTVDGRPAGRLRVVAFSDPGGMDHRGNGLVIARDGVEVTDLPREEVHVLQGHLEQSNVNPIDTLVDMIAAQRSFEVKAKMLTANDELLGKSVNQLGRVR